MSDLLRGNKKCVYLNFKYSAWSGYYQDEIQRQFYPGYEQTRNLFYRIIHADANSIAAVIEAIKPKEAIIGIHKDKEASITDLNISEELKNKVIPERLSLHWIKVN